MSSSVFEIAVLLVSIMLSITFHEAMHALVANWLGDDTAKIMGRATLNPLKHIDPLTTVVLPIILLLSGLPPFGAAKPVPINTYKLKGEEFGAALVGIAGPLTNLLLAGIGGLLLRSGAVAASGWFGDALLLFCVVNVGFFVFNMIPFPPLDGSRLLYAFAPQPLQNLMEQIERLGFVAIGLFVFIIVPFIRPIMISLVQTVTGVLI